MPHRLETTENRCPMCGAGLTEGAEYCKECGERVGERSSPQVEKVRTFLEARYERNLSILEWLLITLGHITWVGSVIMFLLVPMPVPGIIAFFVGSAWIVAGYACAYKKRWGILTGLIVSYLTLGASLLYWKLLAIAASLILSIQAHRVLRFSHQVIAESLGQEKDA